MSIALEVNSFIASVFDEYFVVLISEHVIHQNKNSDPIQKIYLFYSSFKHYFLSKLEHFEQRAEKTTFILNTTSGSYSVILWWSRFPSVLPKIHSPLTLSGSTFHSVIFGSFHLYADDRIIFHMHMLTCDITRFCVFLACVFDRVILDSFRRCVKAPL